MASTHTRAQETVHKKLVELRRVCDGNIKIRQHKVDSYVDSFGKSLQSLRSQSEQNAHNQVLLGKLKVQLRELEDDLVKALAVKTRKEAKRMAIMDSFSETRVKVQELHKIVQDQAARKDEYTALLLEQSKALVESKEKSKQAFMHIQEMQDAFTWYNRVLGFRIDGGHGVKFTFTNINRKCPTEEYSFTIRHSNDVYTIIDCCPHLNGTDKMVNELNKRNDLFNFVRIMREKYQTAASGSESRFIRQDQEFASILISLSDPVSSVSADSRSELPPQLREVNGNIKKVNHRKGAKSPVPSPASSLRRSPRCHGKKHIEH